MHAATVADITHFLAQTADKPRPGRIPTALILTGPSAVLYSSLARQASAIETKTSSRRVFVSLPSTSGSNLKGLLRAVNQSATSQAYEDEDESDDGGRATSRKGTKLLNYDLQILHEYVQERRIQQVVIAFEDTEAFDSDLLSEVLTLLHSWLDRIPFVCLFSIATSVDFLQQRLSSAAIKSLDGTLFDAALSSEEIEQVFEAITVPENMLWLGPGLVSMMLERQRDYLQSIDSLVRAVQYAYMSCYYANALSLFLDPEIAFKDVPSDHFEALRNLTSFQDFAARLLDEEGGGQVEYLLESNEALFSQTIELIFRGRDALAGIIAAIDIIRRIQQHFPNTQVSSKHSLYMQAMSGKLQGSPMLRALLLSIRKAPSDVAGQMMQAVSMQDVSDELSNGAADAAAELQNLLQAQVGSSQPLRSEDDVRNSTLRTTVIAQKVELSKQKLALSKQDAAYTSILRRFTDLLDEYFAEALVDPKGLAFHEIFIYDLKSPYREVFTPRPRHAVERALAAPHDYLDCSCCAPELSATGAGEDGEATLSATQPSTAVLYQLYLESGGLINASDLWQAFRAVMASSVRDDDGSDHEQLQEQQVQCIMAQFQRALAELRYLGFVKGTRKRADHIAKVAWRGL